MNNMTALSDSFVHSTHYEGDGGGGLQAYRVLYIRAVHLWLQLQLQVIAVITTWSIHSVYFKPNLGYRWW